MYEIRVTIGVKDKLSAFQASFPSLFQSCFVILILILISILLSACGSTDAVPATAAIPALPPTAQPTTSPIPIPTTASTPPAAVWISTTGAAIWGTPTLDDATVYFGSDDGNLYALDALNGSLKWKFASNGIVRSQPAISNGLVYFASDDGYLYALETQSGKQAWRTDIGDYMPHERRKVGTVPDPTGFDYLQSSPVVGNGKVYAGSLDGNVYALAADTGKISWRFKSGEKVRANPTLAEGVLYIGSWDKSMYALNALDGQVLWKTPVGGQVQSTAVVANGLVYTASRKASLVALDAQTGKKKWEYDYGTNMWVESSPRLVGNIIYIGSSGSKMVLGFDSLTGKPYTFFLSTAFHWSTPIVMDNMLYIGGTSFSADENKGGLFAFKLAGGKIPNPDQEYWDYPVKQYEILESNWSGVASSPTAQNGMLYFGGLDGKLYALNIAQ